MIWDDFEYWFNEGLILICLLYGMTLSIWGYYILWEAIWQML